MPNLKHRRVMVVEDQYLIADDLCRALLAAGAEVVGPYASEAKALASIDVGGIDGVVLDLDLNGCRSMALAERLTTLNIPFVIASGYPDATIPPRFAGLERWPKPYDPVQLTDALPRLFS